MLNILVVEDDEVDVMNIQRAFSKITGLGTTIVARDGLEALEVLREDRVPRPFIILLDLNMPRMNGYEFLEEIRNDLELKSNIVIALTTSDHEQDIVNCYKMNVAGYIVKPVTFEKLTEQLQIVYTYWNVSKTVEKQ